MKPFDPHGRVRCRTCHHLKESHLQVCGMRDCSCMCFLPETSDTDALNSAVESWQEMVIVAALDLILKEEEGEVFVRTKDGRECRLRVKFEPEVGYSLKGKGLS
jgi:hypothetical protein